jgi:hypothetical protein
MRSNRLLLLLGLASLVFAGCFDEEGVTDVTSGSQSQTDEQAVSTLMSDEDDYFGTGESMAGDQVAVENTGGKQSASGAPIESFYFIRQITGRDVVRDIHIEHPQGEPAVATVATRANLEGIFHLFYDDPDNVYLPGVIDKPLAAMAENNAVFVQRGRPHQRHRGWKLVEISGVKIQSIPTTKEILSLEIISGSVNMVITDPLELMPLPDLPTFLPGEEVTLRVTTSDETDYVFLHTAFLKDEFQPVGGGVFEGTWSVGERRGPRHVAVDVLDRETLFDDEAPYDSAIWVLHYRVDGEGQEDFEG